MVTVGGNPVVAVLVGAVFVALGILLAFRPKLFIRFQMWQQKVFMGAKYIPSRKTESVVKIMGLLFLITGLLASYFGLVAVL